jgi:hypothetical protein
MGTSKNSLPRRDRNESHPDGCVVSLGEGLATQSRRGDNGRMQWLPIDLPDPGHPGDAFAGRLCTVGAHVSLASHSSITGLRDASRACSLT